MTTDPHHQEQGRALTRRSLLAMKGAVAGGLGAGVSLAPPASAHGSLMQANEIAGQRLHYYNGSVDNSRPATTFSFNPTTYNHAEAALNFFYVYTPSTWLRPMHLWLNGVHFDKGGMHQYGRAIDVAYIYNTINGRLAQTFNADWYWWRNQSTPRASASLLTLVGLQRESIGPPIRVIERGTTASSCASISAMAASTGTDGWQTARTWVSSPSRRSIATT